ncbi:MULTISPECIES: DUF2461 domain-containing protein [Streptosporangium]|uniref:Uncharacterized protein (TIGR02453 family) n=1 Tax=Streptosporangium brasiliense TaxID=47480 RepID=A0ABT9RLL2_9ACTN|nr:DUF2461 domain-containing protein [Streptosporangium brasiliense]MDP9870182.1 uncharacterized protein (TIGR02453 family) [Streptosporangium brasiliense]
MGFDGIPARAFAFYEGLAADNSRDYWHGHKEVYEGSVREPLLALLDELEEEFGQAKLFRPQRDTRFAKDKSPYKTYQGVTVGAGGSVGYYLQLEADGLFLGAGFHAYDPAETARYRAAVDDGHTGGGLVKITDRLVKDGFELVGDRVKTQPRGYPADHPRIELLRHSSLGAERRVPRSKARGRGALTEVRDGWRHLRPLVDWLLGHVAKG